MLTGLFALLSTYIQRLTPLRGERGQDLIEYALLGGLIAVALIAASVAAYTGAVSAMANGIKNCIDFDKTTSCTPF